MSSKLKRALIDLLAGFLWLIAFVGLCLYACEKFRESYLKAFLLGVVGLFLNYYLSTFFHEAGHVLFARKTGLAPIKINYGLFTVFKFFDSCENSCEKARNEKARNEKPCEKCKNKSGNYEKEKTRIKIKFSPIFGDAGETRFVATRSVGLADLKTAAAGGLLFSFVYCAAAFCVLLLVKNATFFCLFGAGACSAFYLFSINVIPINKTNDGSLVLFDDYCFGLAEMLEFSRRISAGAGIDELSARFLVAKKTFGNDCDGDIDSDIESDIESSVGGVKATENDVNVDLQKEYKNAFCAYIKYMITVASGKAESACRELSKSALINNIEKLSDEEFEIVFSEFVFACSVCKNAEFLSKNAVLIENYFSNDFCLEKDENVFARNLAPLRAHVAYREFLGQSDWGFALKNTYFRLLKCAESNLNDNDGGRSDDLFGDFSEKKTEQFSADNFFALAEKNLSDLLSR